MMSVHPMVEQINRLIANQLAAGGELFIPGVGSLYVEQRPARRLSKRSVAPAFRAVAFTSQQSGESLVDLIARAAGCDTAKAQDAFDRWLSRTYADQTLTLEGVGMLRFKHFISDAEFDKRLNPHGHQPIAIRPARGFDWVLWSGITAIFIALGFVGYQYLPVVLDRLSGQSGDPIVAVAEPVVASPEIPVDVVVEQEMAMEMDSLVVDTTASAASVVAQPQPAAVSAPAEPVAPATPEDPGKMTAGHSYVVLGVFSTSENGVRALKEAASKQPALQGGVYRFGKKFLAAIYTSADAAACARFKAEHAGQFPDLWIYNAR